jgi:ATP-dependent Clp protease ATP-binding subunit ClpC
LEDGLLTDAEGAEVSFKNTIIILTSNIGTDEFNAVAPVPMGFKTRQTKKETGDKIEEIKNNVVEELEERMRPELLNRLDHIIVFNPLTRFDIKKIAAKELEIFKHRLLGKNLKITIQKGVADFIAQRSFDKNQGARLIRKNISDLVENHLARMMADGKVKNGEITISVKGKELKIK